MTMNLGGRQKQKKTDFAEKSWNLLAYECFLKRVGK
jgi:hypothetical protein